MKIILLSLLLLSVSAKAAVASQRQIDAAQSTLTIHVGKTGLLSAAGHEHLVTAPIADGIIDDGSTASVSFRVESARLTVLPEEHQSEVQHTMQERVLESSRFPEIRFVSDHVQPAGDGQWQVTGQLTLHGVTKPVQVPVRFANGRYEGAVTIKQTDYGIEPVSAGGGTVKVKNELKIDFAIKTK
jgi:polyisoprenoid-binding protein YceI